MDKESKPAAGSDVKEEARNALNQEQGGGRRRRAFEDVASERTTTAPSSGSSTPSARPGPSRKSHEYVTQYPVFGMKNRDSEVPGSGKYHTWQPGEPILAEDVGGPDGLARLMQSGSVITKAVWDAKQAAIEAETVAREALVDAQRDQDDAHEVGIV